PEVVAELLADQAQPIGIRVVRPLLVAAADAIAVELRDFGNGEHGVLAWRFAADCRPIAPVREHQLLLARLSARQILPVSANFSIGSTLPVDNYGHSVFLRFHCPSGTSA